MELGWGRCLEKAVCSEGIFEVPFSALYLSSPLFSLPFLFPSFFFFLSFFFSQIFEATACIASVWDVRDGFVDCNFSELIVSSLE